MKRLLVLGLSAALLVGAMPIASAQETTCSVCSFDFDHTPIGTAARLIAADYGRRVRLDPNIPTGVFITAKLPSVSFEQALAAILSSDLAVTRETSPGGGDVFVIIPRSVLIRRDAKVQGWTLHNSQASDTLRQTLLDSLPGGTGVLVNTQTNTVTVIGDKASLDRAADVIAKYDGTESGFTTEAITILHGARPSDVLTTIQGKGGAQQLAGTSIYASDPTNSIVVTGNELYRRQIREQIATVDIPVRQFSIKVRILDVTPVNDSTDVGLTFGGISINGTPVSESYTTSATILGPPVAGAASTVSVNATLHAMVSKGDASVTLTTTLPASNGYPSPFIAGETIPILQTNTLTSAVTEIDENVGVIINLVPTVTADGVFFNGSVVDSEVIGFDPSGVYPRISKNQMPLNNVRVRFGETLTIAGFQKDTSSDTLTKLPILGDLPGLGAFFRHRQTSHVRNQIVFLLTPDPGSP